MTKPREPGFGRSKLAGLPLALGVLIGVASHPVQALEAIPVALDQAKLVKLPAGAETIVIGNPAIADVAVQKNGVMVITGRSAGRTNFIALDSSGTIISESVVTVTNPTQGRVVVLRGVDQSTYDCAPNCLPTVSMGDDEKHFNRSIDQVGRRDGMANQSSAGSAPKK